MSFSFPLKPYSPSPLPWMGASIEQKKNVNKIRKTQKLSKKIGDMKIIGNYSVMLGVNS